MTPQNQTLYLGHDIWFISRNYKNHVLKWCLLNNTTPSQKIQLSMQILTGISPRNRSDIRKLFSTSSQVPRWAGLAINPGKSS